MMDLVDSGSFVYFFNVIACISILILTLIFVYLMKMEDTKLAQEDIKLALAKEDIKLALEKELTKRMLCFTNESEDIPVRNWLNPEEEFYIKFWISTTTYSEFVAEVRLMLNVPLQEIKLYLVPGNAQWMEARQKINDDVSLQSAMFQLRRYQNKVRSKPYNRLGGNHNNHRDIEELPPEIVYHLSADSPDLGTLVRADLVSPLRSKFLFSHSSGKSSPSTISSSNSSNATNESRSSRSSSDQTAFRNSLLNRDCNKCVFCSLSGIDPNVVLEAAHIIPFKKRNATDLNNIGLSNIHESGNGILLCRSCHLAFDRDLIGVDEHGCIHVCGALLKVVEDEKWGRINQSMILSEFLVAMKGTLCFRYDGFLDNAGKRQLRATNSPFPCLDCRVHVCKTQRELDNHTGNKKCIKNQGMIKSSVSYLALLATPIRLS